MSDRTKVRVVVFVEPEILERIKSQDFNKYEESDGRACAKILKAWADSWFVLKKN